MFYVHFGRGGDIGADPVAPKGKRLGCTVCIGFSKETALSAYRRVYIDTGVSGHVCGQGPSLNALRNVCADSVVVFHDEFLCIYANTSAGKVAEQTRGRTAALETSLDGKYYFEPFSTKGGTFCIFRIERVTTACSQSSNIPITSQE